MGHWMSKFTHNGIEITLNESSGKFSAVVNGEKIISTSLAGIKKKIDKPAEFEPFKALVFKWCELREITIVRKKIGRPKTYGRQEKKWIDENGAEYFFATPDTQEARDAIDRWRRVKEKNKAEIEHLEAEINAAYERIPTMTP